MCKIKIAPRPGKTDHNLIEDTKIYMKNGLNHLSVRNDIGQPQKGGE